MIDDHVYHDDIDYPHCWTRQDDGTWLCRCGDALPRDALHGERTRDVPR